MLRTVSLAVVLFAFAGAAFADCVDGHSAKETLTPDQQANASQAPTTAKTAIPTTKKAIDAKQVKKPVDKSSTDKVAVTKTAY